MKEPTRYQLVMLFALGKLSHVYEGTVAYATKMDRRRKNRMARRSRRTNRGTS